MACVWSGEAGWTCTGWTGWVTWSTMLSERRWENRLHINMKVVVGRRLIIYLRHIQFPFTLPLVQLHFLLLWCRSVPTTAVADRETSLMSCPPPSPRPPPSVFCSTRTLWPRRRLKRLDAEPGTLKTEIDHTERTWRWEGRGPTRTTLISDQIVTVRNIQKEFNLQIVLCFK